MNEIEKLRLEVAALTKVVNECMGKIDALEMREAERTREAIVTFDDWIPKLIKQRFGY